MQQKAEGSISTAHACAARRCVPYTWQSAWLSQPGAQDSSCDRENNEGQQLWIAGTITLLETVLELSKQRERPPKMPSSNLQGRQLRFSQIYIVLDLPQWLTMNSVSCSEKRKQHLLFAWPWKAEEVEDFIYSTLRHGNLQTIVTSQRALVFIFLLSLCGFCLPYNFSQTVCYQPGTSVTCLDMAVSWKEVLCSCMQIIMLLDGRNRSSFDQKALPPDLFPPFLIRTCIISEHLWSLLQYDDGWQEGKLMELVTNQKLANTTEHMDAAEVTIPFHFCLWDFAVGFHDRKQPSGEEGSLRTQKHRGYQGSGTQTAFSKADCRQAPLGYIRLKTYPEYL